MRKAKGIYQIDMYRAWVINFPYMPDRFLVFGTKEDAQREASKIKAKKRWKWAPGFTQVKLG